MDFFATYLHCVLFSDNFIQKITFRNVTYAKCYLRKTIPIRNVSIRKCTIHNVTDPKFTYKKPHKSKDEEK